jgi:aryl-alcohol dehydrogenase-like predicted oxidoreductase
VPAHHRVQLGQVGAGARDLVQDRRGAGQEQLARGVSATRRVVRSSSGVPSSASSRQLALAWLLAQGPDVVPIPGTRRLDRLAENVAAAQARLGADDLRRLEQAVPRSAWSGDRRSFAVPVTTRSP